MSSPKKCAICPIFLLEGGVEEHMRLMHSHSRPSITSQLKSTSAGPKIREVLGEIRQNKAQERQKMELEELTVFWNRGRVVGVSLIALGGSFAEAGRTMGGRGGPNICLGLRTWIVCL